MTIHAVSGSIIGLGWSFACDIFSIGCILVEFFTGDALFQTHDNLEHLAMMEVVMGKLPPAMSRKARYAKTRHPNSTERRSVKLVYIS
jgi:dual-specificity kinase